jgi:hypothetical protein
MRAFARISPHAVVAVTVAQLSFALPASANLVVNGGFEAGNFSGWTQTGNSGFGGVECPGAGFVEEGSCDAFFGPVGSVGGISQTVSTPSFADGSQYIISFAFRPDGGSPSSFSATWDGQTLVSLVNPPASAAYTTYTFVEPATGASTALSFNFRDDPGFLFFDAVSVEVPEPATVAVLGIALTGLWSARRRKAR